MKILLLATSHKSTGTKALIEALKKKGYEYNILSPQQLFLHISNQSNGYNKLFDNRTGKSIQKIQLSEYDLIIPRIGKEVEFSSEVLRYMEEVFGMKSIQSADAIEKAFNKIRSAIHFRANQIRTPKTIFLNDLNNIDIILDRLSTDKKYVIKLNKGSKGKQVSIVSGKAETKSVLDTIDSLNQNIIIQEFIESKGTDIRAIVVGEKVVASYKRSSGKDELRANISTGGEGSKLILNKVQRDFCINCAKSVGLDVAGVDIILDEEGKMYCIEVNHCFGWNVQKFTSINIADKIIEYASELLTNTTIKSKKAKTMFESNLYKETYGNPEFKRKFTALKGKLVQTGDAESKLIKTEKDLQNLLLNHLKL